MSTEIVREFARRVAAALLLKRDVVPSCPAAYRDTTGDLAWPAGFAAGLNEARAVVAAEAPRADRALEDVNLTVLWARSDRYKRSQFVAAWSDGYVESYSDAYREERDERIRWFRDFGDPSDGPWSFWTTTEALAVGCDHAFQHHPESEDVGVCSHCGAEELIA